MPFLILHGGDDEAVPIEQSRRMAEALQTAGIEVIYGEFPGEGHLRHDGLASGGAVHARLPGSSSRAHGMRRRSTEHAPR